MIFMVIAILVMLGILGLSNLLLRSIINSIADDKEPPEELEQSLTIEQ